MSGSPSDRPPDWSSTDELIDSLLDQNDESPLSAVATPQSNHFPQRIGSYSVEKLLGEGGFGRVFLAYDDQLKRHVAIKVAGMGHADLLEDARKAAGLKHDRIVTVYGVETAPDVSFYVVMEYLAGGSLADRVATGGRMSADEAATIVAEVSDAAHHAHQCNIVHRDLKPANILLDSQGRPHIADFGLASSDSHSSDRPGRVCGTARYMSPEQVRGNMDRVDARTDVWSLGVILYELITGQTPFSETRREAVFKSILHDPIDPPGRSHRNLSRDLEAVCLKCLEKRPEQRYQSAAELHDDLRRYLNGMPTKARAAGPIVQTLSWATRRWVTVGLMVAASVLLVASVIGFARHRIELARASQTTTRLENEAAERGRQLRKFEYARTIQAAHQAWKNTDLSSALDLLSRSAPQPGEEDLRSFEWYYLRRLCDGALQTHSPDGGRIYGIAYSPDGSRLASCAADGKVRICESTSYVLLGEFQADQQSAYAIAFSPNGMYLATGGQDSKIRLWSVEDYQLHTVLEGHADGVTCLAYSPDGKSLASGSEDTTVRVWDVATGRLIGTVPGHEKMVHCLAFSPDGTQLFSGSEDGVVLVANPESPNSPTVHWHSDGRVFALAIAPGGHMLAVASETVIHYFDLLENTHTILPLVHSNTVRSIAFSPDGQMLASAGDDQTIRLWETRTQSVQYVYRGHTERIYQMAFSPDNGLLASASKDGSVRIWNPNEPQRRDPLFVGTGEMVSDVAFSPDGTMLASVSHDETGSQARLWDRATGEEIARWQWMRKGKSFFIRFAFLRKRAGLVICSHQGPIDLWDPFHDDVRTFENISTKQLDIAVSPDGALFAVAGGRQGSAVLVDARTGETLASLPGQRCVEFSPDGRVVAFESATDPSAVELWEAETRRSIAILPGHDGQVCDVKFSHDGRYLATACYDGTARLWDVAAGKQLRAFRGHAEGVKRVAFHPSGKRIATASDHNVNFWDVETGAYLLSLPIQPNENVLAIDFSPDGKTLATGSWDGTEGRVDLWHADGKEL